MSTKSPEKTSDLGEKIGEKKAELGSYYIQVKRDELKNVQLISKTKKEIARLLTQKRKEELESE